MKANSQGLEVNVEVSLDELKQLKTEPLEGILKFVGANKSETESDIPLSLCIGTAQKEQLAVRQYPFNQYFGKAREVLFLINDNFYKELQKLGSYGDRFYGSVGKLTVNVV